METSEFYCQENTLLTIFVALSNYQLNHNSWFNQLGKLVISMNFLCLADNRYLADNRGICFYDWINCSICVTLVRFLQFN